MRVSNPALVVLAVGILKRARSTSPALDSVQLPFCSSATRVLLLNGAKAYAKFFLELEIRCSLQLSYGRKYLAVQRARVWSIEADDSHSKYDGTPVEGVLSGCKVTAESSNCLSSDMPSVATDAAFAVA